MNAYPEKQHYTADDLAAIIAILRDPDNGCPWDKVQTHRSIRMNFLEEAYEAVDAIDLDDPELLCEELGDVLMQVVFHAQIEREAGHFTFAEVCDGVCRKLLVAYTVSPAETSPVLTCRLEKPLPLTFRRAISADSSKSYIPATS